MRPLSFGQGVVAAFILAVGAGAILILIAPFLHFKQSLVLLIPGLALGYLTFICLQLSRKTGCMTSLSFWLLVAVGVMFSPLTIVGQIWLHACMISIIRSWHCYSRVLLAVVDLVFTLLSVLLTLWVVFHTSSVVLSAWSFFLLQALSGFIPTLLDSPITSLSISNQDEEAFNRAERRAKQAINAISKPIIL